MRFLCHPEDSKVVRWALFPFCSREGGGRWELLAAFPGSQAVRCWTRRATLGSRPTPGFWVCCRLSSEEAETPANRSLVRFLSIALSFAPSGSERRTGVSPGGENRFHTHIKCWSTGQGGEGDISLLWCSHGGDLPVGEACPRT